ncbi:hypothetical protein ACOZZ3_001865 [Cronobacter dublinensis]
MSAAKKEVTNKNNDSTSTEKKQKTCFIIMPIADHPDYAPGHFNRVYNHLIKPACEMAGYKTLRADDAKASHMIMFDILKKIVECDMAICDLSSKNANVFYELGLRQAFNRKTILITDSITQTPFDITGFRYVKYSEALRVDTVQNDIFEIKSMLQETENASDDDINSIVNLLRIQPATVNKIELNSHESILFDLIKNLDKKISRISETQSNNGVYSRSSSYAKPNLRTMDSYKGKSLLELFTIDTETLKTIKFYNPETGMILGNYVRLDEGNFLTFQNGSTMTSIENTYDNIQIITAL